MIQIPFKPKPKRQTTDTTKRLDPSPDITKPSIPDARKHQVHCFRCGAPSGFRYPLSRVDTFYAIKSKWVEFTYTTKQICKEHQSLIAEYENERLWMMDDIHFKAFWCPLCVVRFSMIKIGRNEQSKSISSYASGDEGDEDEGEAGEAGEEEG